MSQKRIRIGDGISECPRGHRVSRYANGSCSRCAREQTKQWKRLNRGKYNRYMSDYYRGGIDQIARMLLDPLEIAFTRKSRKRRQILRATPNWANHEAIRAIYAECVRLSRAMGIDFEVDHIIPLANPRICGLHIAENLRIVSPGLNRKKGNKL